jgi:hypothetical protein
MLKNWNSNQTRLNHVQASPVLHTCITFSYWWRPIALMHISLPPFDHKRVLNRNTYLAIKSHWKFNRNIWESFLLATVATDNPSICPLLCIIILKGHLNDSCTLCNFFQQKQYDRIIWHIEIPLTIIYCWSLLVLFLTTSDPYSCITYIYRHTHIYLVSHNLYPSVVCTSAKEISAMNWRVFAVGQNIKKN